MKHSKQWHREHAWRIYRLHPNRANLRWYEIWKARQGHFAYRMFDYYAGVPRITNGHIHIAVRRAYARGLVVTATTNGGHATNSYHYRKLAADFGLIPKEIGTKKGHSRLVGFQRQEFQAWQRGERPNIVELIGPDNNMVVLRGRHSPLAEGSALENEHDNHVHIAVSH